MEASLWRAMLYADLSRLARNTLYRRLKSFSTLKALNLTIKRMLKCHPCGSYGYDPLPCCPEK